jgi:hypothetical protein
MRRYARGNDVNRLQIERFQAFQPQAQMAEMNRIERAAEHADCT